MDYLPVLTAGAFFAALALLQLAQRNWQKLPTTFLFAVVSVFLLLYIVNSYGAKLGWVLLGIPAAILVLGAIFRLEVRPAVVQREETPCSCPCCHSSPCSCPKPCPTPKPKAC